MTLCRSIGGALALGVLVVLLVLLLSGRRGKSYAIQDIGLAVNPLGQKPSPPDGALGRRCWDVQQYRVDDVQEADVGAHSIVAWDKQQYRIDESQQLDTANGTIDPMTAAALGLDWAQHTYVSRRQRRRSSHMPHQRLSFYMNTLVHQGCIWMNVKTFV